MHQKESSVISATTPYHRACNTTLFYFPPSGALPTLRTLLADTNINEELLSTAIRTCLQVIFLYGLRSAEALSIKACDYIGAERWFIPGAKGSRGLVCFLPGSTSWHVSAQKFSPLIPLFPFSYMELYRACKRINLGTQLKNHENLARTHSSRYLIARQVAGMCGPVGAQDALRHKRATSTAYYL